MNQTALHIAVIKGYDEMVRLLIEKGCYLDALDNKKCSPLFYAL